MTHIAIIKGLHMLLLQAYIDSLVDLMTGECVQEEGEEEKCLWGKEWEDTRGGKDK